MQAALSRVYAIAEPAEEADPRYTQGLRVAVEAAIDFGFAVVESGVEDPPVPVELLAQARLAARNGISLDTVLRRYFAGYALLEQVVWEEAASEREANRPALQRLARAKGSVFERLIAEVTREYREEVDAAPESSPETRRVARIKRLLAGELLDPADLDYELDQQHVAMIAEGPGALAALRKLARDLDCRLLTAVEEGRVWGWVGTRRRQDRIRLAEVCRKGPRREGLILGLGEPGEGLIGWRRSHLQARAALPVARARAGVARYREVALLSAAMQDDLLATSLLELFVAPLEQEGEGTALRQTLSAYIAAERNVSSAAAGLGVSRHTVTTRLKAIEERLGHSIGSCGAPMEVALQLHALKVSAQPG